MIRILMTIRKLPKILEPAHPDDDPIDPTEGQPKRETRRKLSAAELIREQQREKERIEALEQVEPNSCSQSG